MLQEVVLQLLLCLNGLYRRTEERAMLIVVTLVLIYILEFDIREGQYDVMTIIH